ncbi:MAG: MCE family protein [Alphaproteobacteria bacterium]|nr:MCE family protein [Alphaproteobacteria bacterium]
MQQKKTYKMVGLFVIIGLAALVGVVLKYASQRFTTNQDDLVVMYFEESIRGLSVGSSVVFKGVEVGKVADISLLANLKEGTFKTPVLVLFNLENSMTTIGLTEWDDKQMLDNLIAKGLRARLISANYLTGQLMIELVMDAKTPAVLHGTGKYWEIPTELSSFAMLSQDLEEVPLRETLSRLGNIIQDLEENLPQILKNMAQVTQKVDKALDKKSGEASKSMQGFNTAMEEISKTSRSIKNLTDYLERHPEALLMGKEK